MVHETKARAGLQMRIDKLGGITVNWSNAGGAMQAWEFVKLVCKPVGID